jgi:hypothetical protein
VAPNDLKCFYLKCFYLKYFYLKCFIVSGFGATFISAAEKVVLVVIAKKIKNKKKLKYFLSSKIVIGGRTSLFQGTTGVCE